MNELHSLARAVAERILASNGEFVIDTGSRLFQDLQELAIIALEEEAGEVSRASGLGSFIH